jgi:hypothetical protein
LPVQSRMPVSAAASEALGELASCAAALAAASGGNLLECFAAVPDPRDRHGIRHSLLCVVAFCTAAVLCGNTAIEDVTAWVHHAPKEVLAAAGARRNPLGICMAPHPDTVVRIFTGLGAQALAGHAGAYLALRALSGPVASPVAGPGWRSAVAMDGKAVRGAAGEDGMIPYLLAAVTHGTGIVLAERLIGAKTNQVPQFAPLLRELNDALCFVKGFLLNRRKGFVAWVAEGGHHREGPLAVEGRLLSGHGVSRPDGGPGGGRRIVRRPAGAAAD